MDYDAMMSLGSGGGGSKPPMGEEGGGDKFGPFRRRLGGMLGGFGQAMMDNEARKTFGVARTGGYQDLMENNQIQDFVTGDGTPKLQQQQQDVQAKMQPYKRGVTPTGGVR